MEEDLGGTAGIVLGNVLTQPNRQCPFQSSAFVRLDLIGQDSLSCWEFREQCDRQALSFNKTIAPLAGFYSILPPWKNKKAWARFLVRT